MDGYSTMMLAAGGAIESFKGLVNALCAPYYFVPLMALLMITGLLTYRRWTRPGVAALLGLAFTVFYFGSCSDPDFFRN